MFDLHGWVRAASGCTARWRAGDTEGMLEVITDEMLDEYAVTASWDHLAEELLARYGGLVDRLFTSSLRPMARAAGRHRTVAAVAAAVRSG